MRIPAFILMFAIALLGPALACGPLAAQTATAVPAVTVLIFVSVDCPIANRYAPEIQRLQAEFAPRGVEFKLVYPETGSSDAQVAQNAKQYGYSIATERDPDRVLVKQSHASITPEAALFAGGRLVYHGRIDNWVAAFGKVRPAATTHELQDAIQAALAGQPPPVAYAPAVGCYLSDLR